MVSTTERGKAGECAAATFLSEHGAKILAKNFRTRTGEVDIIVEHDGVLIFVEVKSWSAFAITDLEYSISVRKQRRIRGAAEVFLANNRCLGKMVCRFDVCFVRNGQVEWIRDAFTPHGAG